MRYSVIGLCRCRATDVKEKVTQQLNGSFVDLRLSSFCKERGRARERRITEGVPTGRLLTPRGGGGGFTYQCAPCLPRLETGRHQFEYDIAKETQD